MIFLSLIMTGLVVFMLFQCAAQGIENGFPKTAAVFSCIALFGIGVAAMSAAVGVCYMVYMMWSAAL